MREILYRGQRTDNKQLVHGFYDCITDNYNPKNRHYIQTFKRLQSDEIIWLERFEVNPETVSQYIGQKDCNGNKYFVGDIGKLGNTSFAIRETVNGWEARKLDKKHSHLSFSFLPESIKIGNIFENSELLEEI